VIENSVISNVPRYQDEEAVLGSWIWVEFRESKGMVFLYFVEAYLIMRNTEKFT
jgi:hypothetical protein